MNSPQELLQLLEKRDFFEQGAFIADTQKDEIWLGWGGLITHVQDYNPELKAFYFKDFYQQRSLCYVPDEWFHFSLSAIKKALSSFPGPLAYKKIQDQDQLYQEDFARLKEQFGPKLKKVVLVSREEFEIEDQIGAPRIFFKKALEFEGGHPYGLWYQGQGMIGSTPELLFRVDGDQLRTFALAGTVARGKEHELLHSSKDRLEHDFVTIDIIEKISPFCEELKTFTTDIATFGRLAHLKTNIEGTMKTHEHLADLTYALSPTAALGGYPTQEALEFLKTTSYYKRYPQRYFGSAFGLIRSEIKQFLVAIRNVQWNQQRVIIESGGGVLAESHLDKELAEIHLKRETIKQHYLCSKA